MYCVAFFFLSTIVQFRNMKLGERDRDVTKIKSLLPFVGSVDSRDANGRTPLMNAVLDSNVQEVISLVNRGADPSLADNKGRNLLHLAALHGDTNSIDVIHTRMQNIESKSAEGMTPIMFAALGGQLQAVEWFF